MIVFGYKLRPLIPKERRGHKPVVVATMEEAEKKKKELKERTGKIWEILANVI